MSEYTQRQLVAEAKRAGYKVTGKLIERWVTLGLLDQARAIGRGRGQGVDRRWPQSQSDLLLSLLHHRENAPSVRALLNIPVLVWLIWGEDYVPLRQVQRAIETWVRMTDRRRSFQARRWATAIVRNLARPRAPARARQILIDELAQSVESGWLVETEVRRRLDEVVGPRDPTMQTDGPRAYQLIAAQLALVRRYAELTVGHFGWARMFYLYSQADYAAVRAELASDPRFGKLHEPFDFERLANRACHDLSIVLSLALDGGPAAAATPEMLRLEPWLAGRARLHVEVDLRRSPLWLPRGVPNAGLGISVRVDIDPSPTAL